MLHKAYGILHDYQLAEDAVSEALIRIYKNLSKIEDPNSNRSVAYLITIVKNTALSMLSKEQGKAYDPIEETVQDEFDLEDAILSDISSGEIMSVVDLLGEELKGVFLLKYAYDLPHKEIGKQLGISENNVTVRLHRAKKKLAALLVKEGYAYEEAKQ